MIAPPCAATLRKTRAVRAGGQLRGGEVVRLAALARGGGVADLDQRLAPVVGQGAEPRRAHDRGQRLELAGAAPGQEGAERLEVLGGGGQEVFGHRGEAEEVDVEVAGRGGQVAEPLELGAVLFREAGGQDVAEQLDRGPGAAHGDPQVVQELGVDVADHAVDVLLQGVQQAQQQDGDRDGRGHRRGDLRVHAVGVVGGVAAERAEGFFQEGPGGGAHAGGVGQQAGGAAGLGGVAADFGDEQAGGEPRGDAGLGDGRGFDDQPGHRLAVRVGQAVHADRGGSGGDREQRSRGGQLFYPVSDGARW